MGEPNLRLLLRNLRLREEAKAKGVCHECGQKLPKEPKKNNSPASG